MNHLDRNQTSRDRVSSRARSRVRLNQNSGRPTTSTSSQQPPPSSSSGSSSIVSNDSTIARTLPPKVRFGSQSVSMGIFIPQPNDVLNRTTSEQNDCPFSIESVCVIRKNDEKEKIISHFIEIYKSDPMVWSCTIKDTTYNIDITYLVEIPKKHVEKVYLRQNQTKIVQIIIKLNNAPIISEKVSLKRIAKNRNEDLKSEDTFLESVKYWEFSRALIFDCTLDIGSLDHMFDCEIISKFPMHNIEPKPNLKFDESIPFSIRFLMMCLNTRFPGLLVNSVRFQEIQNKILDIMGNQPLNGGMINRITRCLRNIPLEYESFNYNLFPKIFEEMLNKEEDIVITKTLYVNRIVITPLCLEYYQAEETGNRVVRKYNQELDFLRVSFGDDSRSALSISFTPKHFQNYFESTITNGISICGLKFNMLAYSNSQLKSISAWFVADTNVQRLIDGLGDFSNITEKSKYGARVALCFSTTKNEIPVKYMIIDDYERFGYIFNDGIGKMSRKFAEKFAITKNGVGYIPSAIQFRMGTFKGVVQVEDDPLFDKYGVELLLSKNQNKVPGYEFKLETVYDGSFELITHSERKGVGYLNRQLISLLLTANGVPLDNLKQLVKLEIEKVRYGLKHAAGRMNDNQICKNLTKFYKLDDPFARKVEELFRKSSFKTLLDFRIPVDESNALIGGFCFSDELEPDEVFIQLSPQEECEYYSNGGIVEGPILVTRSPTLHPGDILKLTAVNKPNLRHLKDIVVFSSKGDRPQPSKSGGGDLDGDIFSFFNNKYLIERFVQQEAMQIEAKAQSKQTNTGKPPNFETIRKFFIEYSNSTSDIGRVAMKHAEMADKEDKGTLSGICIKLAELHSKIVDSGKTGEFHQDELNKLVEKCYSRPHYISSPNIPSYNSKSLMGKLYTYIEELVDNEEMVIKNSNNIKHPKEELKIQILDSWKEHVVVNEIKKLYSIYKNKLSGLLVKYSIKSEAKLITGFFNTKSIASINAQSDFVLRGTINQDVSDFFNEFQVLIDQLFEKYEENSIEIAQLFYHVKQEENKKFLSFYWLVMHKILPNKP